jgi:Pentapeptide repeats (8 copies)
MNPQRPTTEADDSEPTPERQVELRAAYDANVAAGKAPYEGVEIRTRGELQWVMHERDWTGEHDAGGKLRANFRGTRFHEANLNRVHLVLADLSGADLNWANLGGATLREANLSSANLWRANLRSAGLYGANLGGADLRTAHLDAATVLAKARLDVHTLLADTEWNGAAVTRLNWKDVASLGDEYIARQPKDADGKPKDKDTRLEEFQDAVMANRQVATLLRSQGLNEHADRFAYRAQVLQRVVLGRQRQWLRWFGSLVLWLVAGYGYRPLRSFVTYAVVVLGFAAAYFVLGGAGGKAIAWNEAIVISMTAFHGRGFFSAVFQPGDLQAAVAAVEAFFGLLIEITFIATFTQRFFAR